MSHLQLKVLDLGDMTFYKKELIATPDSTQMVVSPALAVLIRHPEAGWILYDTGNDPDWASTYNDAMKGVYPITRLISITEALAKEGLTPKDIDILALSHMHFDHAGGLPQFANTPAVQRILVSQKELDCANSDGHNPTSAYMAPLFEGVPGIGFQTVCGEYQVAEGVSLFPQCCHTPGLMGLRVELKNQGTVIFTSDSVYTEDSDRLNLPPGGNINRSAEEFYQNLEILRQMKKRENATLFYGHDIVQARQWQERGWIN